MALFYFAGLIIAADRLNRRTGKKLSDGWGAMSKPVKLLLACLLCLAVIVGIALLIQALIQR